MHQVVLQPLRNLKEKWLYIIHKFTLLFFLSLSDFFFELMFYRFFNKVNMIIDYFGDDLKND